MKKEVVFLILIIFLLFPRILSECSSDQIDINSASKSELEKIKHIGPVYAERIRNQTPFDSLEKLKEVKGIAEKRLEEIKEEDLACVETENSEEDKEEDSSLKKNKSEKDNPKDERNSDKEDKEKKENYNFEETEETERRKDKKPKKREVVRLSSSDSENQEEIQDPKTIKNLSSFKFQENKNTYANYGLIAVMVIVMCSMLTKYKKNKYKNEFRE